MGKPVSASAVRDYTYKVFPNDLNSHLNVFGGLIMSTIDRVACVVAERHSEKLCVTASLDSMHFLAPAGRGDILVYQAAVNRVWRSSMEIGVKVLAENYRSGEKKHIVSAYLTFVAVDDDHNPTPVPELILETDLERRRYQDAEIRRENRKKVKDERLKHRDNF